MHRALLLALCLWQLQAPLFATGEDLEEPEDEFFQSLPDGCAGSSFFMLRRAIATLVPQFCIRPCSFTQVQIDETVCDHSTKPASPFVAQSLLNQNSLARSLGSTQEGTRNNSCTSDLPHVCPAKTASVIHSNGGVEGSHHLYIKLCQCMCKSVDKIPLKMDSS